MKTLRFVLTICVLFSIQKLHAQYITPGNQLSLSLNQLVNLSGGVVTFSDGTYFIHNTLTISPSDTLAIRETAVVRVANGIRIEISGTVISDPIAGSVIFTAIDTTSTSTNFKGFRFEDSPSNVFRNTTISYGGGLQLISSDAVFEHCVFRRNGSSNVSAVVTYSNCDPVVSNCSFIENSRSAIGSGANVTGSPLIVNNIIYHNTTDNSNRPQINLGPGATDTVYIIGNYVEGFYDNSGGIGISNLVGVGNTKVVLRNNYIIGNRYGYAQIGNNISGLIEDNELIDNNIQNQPNLGGSGLNFQASGSGNVAVVHRNIIRGNLWGVTIQGTAQPAFGTNENPGGNIFFENGNNGQTYALYNNTALAVNAIGNYWGSNDPVEAENNIFHQPDQASLGLVSFLPLLEIHPVIESFVFLADENPGLASNSIGVIDQTNHSILLTVPSTVNISSMIPQITLPTAVSIDPQGGVPTDFSSPVTYTLATPHGESMIYTVTVEVETASYTVTFNILDASGNAVSDATLAFAGIEQPQGVYVVENVVPGDYPYEVHHPLFQTAFGSVNVTNQNLALEVMLQLLSWPVDFEVKDGNGTMIADATISLDGMQNAPGDYLFENVEPGTYDYIVTKEGYTTVNGQVVVVDGPVSVLVNMELIVFDCTFIVTEAAAPSEGATVVLNGNLSQTTDVNGTAVFEDLAYGIYNYVVSKPSFVDKLGTFNIYNQNVLVNVELEVIPGFTENHAVDFNLSPNPATDFFELKGKFTGIEKLMIYNLDGVLLTEIALQGGTIKVDISALKPGVYTVVIRSKKFKVLRLVKQ